MLTYSLDIDAAGNLVFMTVTEVMHSAIKTRVTTVRYKPDLSEKQVNDDPWTPVSLGTKNWFETYYRKHFNQLQDI